MERWLVGDESGKISSRLPLSFQIDFNFHCQSVVVRADRTNHPLEISFGTWLFHPITQGRLLSFPKFSVSHGNRFSCDVSVTLLLRRLVWSAAHGKQKEKVVSVLNGLWGFYAFSSICAPNEKRSVFH